MTNSQSTRNLRHLIICCVAIGALGVLPLLSSAKSSAAAISIVNNSSRVIRHVYLSPVNVDNLSEDQLGGSTISAGQTHTLNNVACDQSQIKIIGEDQDGCFLTAVVACGDSATWTITSDTPATCGQ